MIFIYLLKKDDDSEVNYNLQANYVCTCLCVCVCVYIFDHVFIGYIYINNHDWH